MKTTHLLPALVLALAAGGLTLAQARVQSQPVHQWRQQPFTPDNRTPVVFALGR